MRFEQASAPFYAAVVAVALSVGYFAGVSTSKPRDQVSRIPKPTGEISKEEEESSDAESETSSVQGDQDLSSVELLPEDECKLVLVVRSDLGMSTGKIAAQCSHATLACYKSLLASNVTLLRRWEKSGQTKIALRCSNEEELLTLQAQAQSLNLCARSIQDAGRTQIAAGSRTVLGILGPVRLVNRITGTLRLL
ncbi:hypothetical protein VNI00_001912 [Paramarasmius palmivorus]|uniref:peptidyl-tRNA hydrolase n=1 Tax=Paramarasmius palmivorus TaxID=297713 RepID=A0AAW0E084_9AGAR